MAVPLARDKSFEAAPYPSAQSLLHLAKPNLVVGWEEAASRLVAPAAEPLVAPAALRLRYVAGLAQSYGRGLAQDMYLVWGLARRPLGPQASGPTLNQTNTSQRKQKKAL